jgi:UDP-glucose 4-epimerase
VLYAFNNGHSGDIFIQKAPAATIETLAHALTTLLDVPEYKLNIIGTRHGEKLYETLLTREEMIFAEDLGDYYRIKPDLRDLNYGKYFDQGEVEISNTVDYNSHNTKRLDLEEMKSLLMQLTYIQAAVSGNHMQQY